MVAFTTIVTFRFLRARVVVGVGYVACGLLHWRGDVAGTLFYCSAVRSTIQHELVETFWKDEAMAALHPPAPYNPGEDFDRWLRGVEFYLVAVDVTSPERKAAVVQTLMGLEVQEIVRTLP